MSRLIAQLSVAYLRLKGSQEKIQFCAPNLLIPRPLYFQGNRPFLPPAHWPIVNGRLLMNNGRAENPIKQGSPQKEKKKRKNQFHNQRLKNINTAIRPSIPHRVTAASTLLLSHPERVSGSQAAMLRGAFVLFPLVLLPSKPCFFS